MASSSSHRRRPARRGTWVLSAIVVATVALVASLIVAFVPDDGNETTASAVGAESSATPTTPRPTPSSASPKATATATKAKPSTTPSPTASTPKPRPSTAGPRQTAATVGSLAGRIRPGTTYEGVATFYDTGNGDGACSYGPTDDTMTAAMNHTDYETSQACGAYVLVRAGGASVTVRITNECPLPCAPGQLDLSPQAFAKLAAPSRGEIPITWTLLSPASSEKISIRYKTGSTQYWCGIQAIGHRNPLARLEVRTGSGWTRLARTEYNYFLSEQGRGCGGSIRITDIYGEQLTVDGIALRAEAVQPTGVQFAAH
ncbi:RlpA-like double-psi beta-barrel domain-containing protein [Streptomyces sp. NBC_00124]|uniref:expansin EXLX1 family cellulose-binding protein n=1 Tax=Streptomyces sp. NBC_00124 TaxID=2975662 RepID=UPI00225B6191|nr:expansin EXLX1 family cellulose-binding protein [Streptomyces sp. NBC_00124]MCX5366355.1 RlpA-like double-psi beta-barrel domain-containing protein [Streptomyces sp. NBC_00124]